ncbi:hypothetical protein ACFLXT_00015 [Chloroflexota bacterium]
MQALGVYFDIIQATQTPNGPFGLSILVWGVILFTLTSISIIAQLWWYIHKTEGSYEYALSFDEIACSSSKPQTLRIMLKFSNTLDKPMGYKIDVDSTYIKIGDEQSAKLQNNIAEGVISKFKTEQRFLPEIRLPESYPCQGTLHCELLYGIPDKLSFRQVREWSVEINGALGTSQGLDFDFVMKYQADYSMRSKSMIRKILRLD